MSIDTEELVLLENDTVLEDFYNIVVYNDNVNTFDHVIETLIDTCGHTSEQAEQCTLLIHYKGKCSVKRGDYTSLSPIRNAICNRGLSSEIE